MHFLKHQRIFLEDIAKNLYFRETFYLIGDTALAACYLNHRLSEDIDLFTNQKLDELRVNEIVAGIAKQLHLTIEFVRIQDRLGYTIQFPTHEKLKVNIVSYDFEQIEKPSLFFNELPVDSFSDIAVYKLMTISQRTASKDFVDLYFILKKYTVWDLRLGVKHKFKMEIEPFYLSSLFVKAEELQELPIMKKN